MKYSSTAVKQALTIHFPHNFALIVVRQQLLLWKLWKGPPILKHCYSCCMWQELKLHTGSLFKACHRLKDGALLCSDSALPQAHFTFTSIQHLNFPCKVFKNNQAQQLLSRFHQYFAFTWKAEQEGIPSAGFNWTQQNTHLEGSRQIFLAFKNSQQVGNFSSKIPGRFHGKSFISTK